jgi:hypothetical protein
LLSCNPSDFSRGFNKSYNNTALRFGVIKNIYPVNDPKNVSNLSTEYDVDVIEQDMNRGIAPVTYKNCLTVDGLGSIADFFEKNSRVQTQSKNLQLPLTAGQNGATVLVLCLDATTGKGIILGGLNHPDRPTNLTSAEPQLYGEYNGVAVQINPDGSTSLTFNGATDNDGEVINPSQGTTVFSITTDGSYEFTNSAVTIQGTKSGTINITCTGPANIIAQGVTTVDGSHINLGQSALEAVIKGDTFAKIYDNHYHIGNLGVPTGPPDQPMDPALSTHVSTE